MLTLGQLAAGSRGGGSVLLYSRELQQQGLVAVNSRQAHILESWGNGTNTEVGTVEAAGRLCCVLCVRAQRRSCIALSCNSTAADSAVWD
jgi:hypothetical protein